MPLEDDEADLETFQGSLMKLGGSVVKRDQKRWFELRNRKLYYYNEGPLGVVDLHGVSLVNEQGCSWTLTGPALKHPYRLSAASAGEKAAWMARIMQAINKSNSPSDMVVGTPALTLPIAHIPALAPSSVNTSAGETVVNYQDESSSSRDAEIEELRSRLIKVSRERDELQAKLAAREAAQDSTPPNSFPSSGGAVEGDEATVISALRRQLEFEREEQRVLRADLHQEIDRLKEELVGTHARMATAEEQAEQFLHRAAAAAAGRESSLHTPRGLGGGGGSGSNSCMNSPRSHHHSRSMDFDTIASRIPGATVPESELQAKLEHKMVQQYIELRKVLHDLREMGMEHVEYAVTLRKLSANDNIGLSFRPPENLVTAVAPGLPGDRCGIKKGMRIMMVDGHETPTYDDVLPALLADGNKLAFSVVVREPTGCLVGRLEGKALLAEEREAILVENDNLAEQVQQLRTEVAALQKQLILSSHSTTPPTYSTTPGSFRAR